jgi:type I restriction enzyme S subunit
VIDTRPLRHLAGVRISNVDKKSVEGEVPVRLCNYTDVYYGDRITPALDLMAATATTEQVRAFGLRQGDVLITKDSEDASDIGVPAFVDETAPDLVCGYHLAVLRPKPEQVDGRYLYWTMLSRPVQDHLSVSATGITRYGLRADSISSTPIPWWSLAQQRAIADYLDTDTARIDALIAKKRRTVDVLAERLQATIDLLTEGPTVALRRAVSQFVDYRGATPDKSSSGIPLVTATHVKGGEIVLSLDPQFIPEDAYNDWMRRGWPVTGDVLMTTEAPLGEVAWIMDSRVALAQRLILMKADTVRMTSQFLGYAMRATQFQSNLYANATGSTALGIKADRLKGLPVSMPPLETQVALADRIMRAERQVRQHQRLLQQQGNLLVERRQSLISAAVTGELSIPGAVS